MLALATTVPLSAQPVLEINRVNGFNFPEVRVFFSVTCNGVPRYDIKKENITLKENGEIITDFDIICPDPNGTCCMSVALVFDRSSSMTPQKMQQSKTAGKVFVDLMNGNCDQATVVSFSSDVSVDMPMTNDKLALKGAIDGLSPNGMTAMWDGAGKGLEEVINRGVNPCKAVILLTDGQENSSMVYDFLQVIALAKANNIRVYTIGLGTDAAEYPLQLLAQETGGTYYSSPTGDDLESIYRDIHTTISHRFMECEIIYQSECPDGTERTIELTVGLPQSLSGCPGYDTKTATYKTPRDPSQFKPIRISLGQVTVVRGENVDVPLTLEDDVNGIFNSAEFKVLFDAGCCRFLGVTTDGYLLDGVQIEWYPVPGGIQFKIRSPKPISGKGILAMLQFTAFSRDCDLYIQDWIFSRGCLKPVFKAGKLIIARLPEVNCALKIPAPPVWDPAATQYSPDPFEVRIELFNYGNLEARNVQVTLSIDPRDFELVDPQVLSQAGDPVNMAADGGRSEAGWLLSVRRRSKGDSVRICIEARFDNHLPVKCCKAIWIPPTGPILNCSLTVPEITVNTATFRYEPMPFTLDAIVRNDGGEKTGDVYATINLVPDLRLVSEPGNHQVKKLFPAQLKPGEQGKVSWRIMHPASPDLKTYKIEVWVRTKGADSTKCEVELTIPPMPGPVLKCDVLAPDSLEFDKSSDEYLPNPFPVAVAVRNFGTMAADSVRARLLLPPGFELDPPGQPEWKVYTPAMVEVWKGGDTARVVSWTVRFTGKLPERKCLKIESEVRGRNPSTLIELMPSFCEKSVCLPKSGDLKVECMLELPDSIGINSSRTALTPNPFVARYVLWNSGNLPTFISYVQLFIPDMQGISIQQPPAQSFITINRTLAPGDTIIVEWVLYASNSEKTRRPLIEVVARSGDDREFSCKRELSIAPLDVALLCTISGPDTLRYQTTTKMYQPDPFELNLTLKNISSLFLQDVETCIELPPGLALHPVRSPDSCLGIGQVNAFRSANVTWYVSVTSQPRGATVKEIKVRYRSSSLGDRWFECSYPLFLQAAGKPSLACSLSGPDSIRFIDSVYVPAVFPIVLDVTNNSNWPLDSIVAYVIQDSRFNIEDPRGALRLLATRLESGEAASATFQLRVHPRVRSGYDTVRIVVLSNGVPPTVCQLPIWVESAAYPDFYMKCSATPDSLVFDVSSNDYRPNPFTVTTTVENRGAAHAENCKLIFVGPPRFTPLESSVVEIGRLDTLQSVQHSWELRALQRRPGGVDTLIFQVQGNGGLGGNTVIGECRIPVFVPAFPEIRYAVTCDAPRELTYESGRYLPDPFLLKATIRNVAAKIGTGVEATLALPPGVELASGESMIKSVRDLQPGESAIITWRLKALKRQDAASLDLCVSVRDSEGEGGQCCSSIRVPEALKAPLLLQCSVSPDTLRVDPERLEYLDNPFRVSIIVRNPGSDQIARVTGVVIPQSPDVVVEPVTPSRVEIAPVLSAGDTARWTWLLRAKSRSAGGPVAIKVVVSSEGGDDVACTVVVEIPALPQSSISCLVSTEPGDTLHFDYSRGVYERNPFTVATTLSNHGVAAARDIRVTITLPPGTTLGDGEHALKIPVQKELTPGDSLIVSWNVKAVRRDNGALRRISILAMTGAAQTTSCYSELYIQGAPRIAHLRIPRDIVGKYGDVLTVPILIDETIGKDIRNYRIRVSYDSSVVQFMEPVSKGTLTAYGWIGPRFDRVDGNTIEIYDQTTGTAIPRGEGAFVVLLFKAVYGNGAQTMGIAQSEIELRSMDLNRGAISTFGEDGLVTVSGECVIPLVGSGKYALEQNTPNPFNPSTFIEFSVADDIPVRLVVFDALGRRVRTLVNSRKERGRYRVVFEAGELPSGLYFYRLETPAYTAIRKMILAR